MEDTAADLRATSDDLMRDLEVLGTIEDEKRTLKPGDPRLVELAERIEEIAKRVLSGSVRQRRLTEVGHEQVEIGAPDAPAAPIADTPRPIADILAAWREAERRLGATAPDSAEAVEARALADHCRDEYRRALEERRTTR
jgi:hypothetical protein